MKLIAKLVLLATATYAATLEQHLTPEAPQMVEVEEDAPELVQKWKCRHGFRYTRISNGYSCTH